MTNEITRNDLKRECPLQEINLITGRVPECDQLLPGSKTLVSLFAHDALKILDQEYSKRPKHNRDLTNIIEKHGTSDREIIENFVETGGQILRPKTQAEKCENCVAGACDLNRQIIETIKSDAKPPQST